MTLAGPSTTRGTLGNVSSALNSGVSPNGPSVTQLTDIVLAPPPAPPRVRPSRLPALRRIGDPLLVGLVSFVVYALHGNQGPLGRDLGVFTYGGEHVAKGVPPYVGIFNSVGPLADAIPGAAIWLGNIVDADPILVARLAFMVISALCCALVCVLARDVFLSRAAGFVAPAVFLTFLRFTDLASSGPREKTPMVLFLLLALILLLRRRWLAAGLFGALATLTWQPSLAVVLVAFVATVVVHGLRRREAWDAVVGFLAGGSIPSVLTVAYFLSQGALKIAVDGFLVVNLYTRQPGALSDPTATWQTLYTDFQQSLYVVVAGLVALLLLSARATVQIRRRSAGAGDPVARRLVIVGAGALAGTAWTLAVVNGGPDLFELLPFAALGLTGLVLLAAGHLPRPAAVVLVVAVSLVGLVSGGIESVATERHVLIQERADVDAVLATQPPEAQVLSIDAPQVLALSGRDNPSSLQIFTPSQDAFLRHRLAGGLKGYAARVRALQPTFVVVGGSYRGTWADAMLAQDYWRVGHGTSWTWYLNRSAGPDALLAARQANRAAMLGNPDY